MGPGYVMLVGHWLTSGWALVDQWLTRLGKLTWESDLGILTGRASRDGCDRVHHLPGLSGGRLVTSLARVRFLRQAHLSPVPPEPHRDRS